jgi:transcriptional regulator EpsA
MIDPILELGAEQWECFAWIVEASLQVHRNHQFLGWTQAALQKLIPHEILICGVALGTHGRVVFQRFTSTRYFREEHFADLTRAGDGLLARMMARWTGEPWLLGPESAAPEPDWLEQVRRNELVNAAAQGVLSAEGTVSSFFCFGRVGAPLDVRLELALQLLAPHLHATYARVTAGEEGFLGRTLRARRVLTEREVEILRWIRDGKTNRDVADILEMSPFTVKNHIQKILRKMRVENRSHAVARAISLGILPAGGQ